MQDNLKKTSKLKRSLQIIFGVLFLVVCLLLILISIMFIIDLLDSATSIIDFLLVVLLGGGLLFGSIWITILTLRLIFNKQKYTTHATATDTGDYFAILLFIIIEVTISYMSPTIFSFHLGMGLTMFIIFSILWVSVLIAERKATPWQKYSSVVIMGGIVMGFIFLMLFSSVVMEMLAYFYKPFPLDERSIFIAGSVTSVIIVIVWLSYSFVLNTLNLPDDAWQVKLLSGSPFIVVMLSLTLIYYFFS